MDIILKPTFVNVFGNKALWWVMILDVVALTDNRWRSCRKCGIRAGHSVASEASIMRDLCAWLRTMGVTKGEWKNEGGRERKERGRGGKEMGETEIEIETLTHVCTHTHARVYALPPPHTHKHKHTRPEREIEEIKK